MGTNDEAVYEAAKAFRKAAVEDGWSIKPTYSSESVDSASTLRRDGFQMSILTRRLDNLKYKYSVSIDIWGPDELVVMVPDVYGWEPIRRNLNRCNYCKKYVATCTRVSFAGRVCPDCDPKVRPSLERQGWAS